METPGPAFVNILAPCVLFWKIEPQEQMKLCFLIVPTAALAESMKFSERRIQPFFRPKKVPLTEEEFTSTVLRGALPASLRQRMDLVAAAQADVVDSLLKKCGG